MNDIDIAKSLFGEPKSNTDALIPGRTRTYSGIAVANSSNGYVQVRPDADVVTGEDDGVLVLPTKGVVNEGDIVNVTVVNGAPMVDGSIGWGDELEETVGKVTNYFWHDEDGAHVSSAMNSIEGGNVLIDTDSLDIRDGTDVIATFRKDDTRGDGMAIELKHWRTAGIVASEDDNDWYLGINAGTVMGSKGSTIDLTSNGSRGTSILTMTDGGMTCSVTKGTYPNTNTVRRNLGFATSHGNISSQGTSAQAQFVTNGFMAMLMVGNDTTPTGQWGSKTLCTIPANYRPLITVYYPIAKSGAAQGSSYVMIDASNGVVTLQNAGGTQASVNYWATCTWCY